MPPRKNKIRAFRKLYVWQDARDLYVLTWKLLKDWPYELNRLKSNQLASVDSIHRNIAEGYCRKTIREYLQFLNIAKGSLGESISAMHVYLQAGHLVQEAFEAWDQLSYRLENRLIRLIESLEKKRDEGDWNDTFLLEESIFLYGIDLSEEE